jgi:predicted amidohydrolase YtcJ
MKAKFIQLTLILTSFLFFSLNCGKNEEPNNSNEIVFFNGKIYTVNSSQSMVDAIFVKDGIIEYVGTNEEAKNRASENATQIDLNGKFMMPGIHDVHMHPLEASSNNFKFIVDENEADPENYASDVETAMQQNPVNGWLLGWGHYLETVLDATRSPKEILDDVAPDRPVAIMEQTSHSVWCNSKALELMGITIDSENPIGGIIMRETNDEPNGILIDNAGNLLLELALQPTTQSQQNDYDGLVEYGLPELAKHGITSICDARTYWKRNHHETWIKLANEDKLTARVNLALWTYPTEEDASQIAMLKSLYQNEANSLLKINQIKLYSDGIIHNTTSAMHDDYLIDYFEEATNNGLNYFTEQRVGEYIAALESTGFDFHIHAIGNRGIHESLNAIQNNGTTNGRHRLTHVEFMDAVDIPRFAQLNVTADAQVAGDFTNPMHWHDNDYLVGAALSGNIIPLKDLQNANARITLSSDWDVSSLNPFVGLKNAVTRSPQNISIEEAIKAYTINAAYVMRQEDKVGSIEIGKAADLIILDRNLLEINVAEIGETKVEVTYLQGEIVYEK